MDNLRAYGAGLANNQFNSSTFVKKPTVVFKGLALIFGVLMWYAVSSGAWHKLNGSTHHQICLYGNSSSTCSFGSALGFFAMAGAAALLYADAKFESISSVPTRKKVVLADLIGSVAFTVIHLIAFFTLWSKLSSLEVGDDEEVKTGKAKLSILLSLFSFIVWGGAAFFAWRRHEEGAVDAYANNFDEQFGVVSSDVQDGYGYGGNSEGVGSVGVPNQSYQSGGPPPVQPGQPPANPFVGGDGYGY